MHSRMKNDKLLVEEKGRLFSGGPKFQGEMNMEWKLEEGKPFPAGLGEDSPVERMRVPLYIRQGGQAVKSGLYQWELSRRHSILTAMKGPALLDEEENTPEFLISSEVLSLTEQEFLEWLQGKKGLEELNSGEDMPYWCSYIEAVPL